MAPTTTTATGGSRQRTGRPGRPAGRPGYDTNIVTERAVEVFLERGFDGTSMGMLADALGISKSSIYHHVASKDALLERALDRALDALTAVGDEPGACTGPAIDRIEYRVRRGVEILTSELPYVTLLLRVRGNTEVERRALRRRRELDAVITELMTQAREEGDLRPGLDPGIAARLLFGALNSISEWYQRRDDGDEGAQRIADNLIRLTFEGLRAPDRRG